MKKFLLKTILFFLLAVLLYIPCLFLYASLSPRKLQKNMIYNKGGLGHLYTRLQEADTTQNIDVLIIGSSHAYRGFDPRIFEKNGLKIFVLGSSSQTPVQTEYLINKYIDKLKPKTVLYEVYYATFGMDGTEGAIDLFSNVRDMDYLLFNMAVKLNNIKTYNTYTYAYLNNMVGRKKIIESKIKDKDVYVNGGFVERKNTGKPYIEEIMAPEAISIDKNQLQSFRNICQALEKRHIQTILVQAPVAPGKYYSITNRDSLDKFFSSIPAAKYYNFNDVALFGQKYFFDSHHLNQNGVVLFNNLLINKLFCTDNSNAIAAK